MTGDPRLSGHIERRLQRAAAYVSDMWFPANPLLLSKLQTAVQTDYFFSDIDSLITEIEGDYSLFFYCLKELTKLLQDEGIVLPSTATPREMLKLAGVERLRQILSVSERNLSRHSFMAMSAEQKSRIEEAIISASATQVLAKTSELSPELGFSAALLRQLGYTLIAWNYPEAYQRAKNLVRQGLSLDVAVSKLLGFSPTMLAMTLSQKWGLYPGLQEAFDEQQEAAAQEDAQSAMEAQAGAHVLVQLCKIGEALARANDPENYPTARRDWETAKTEIFTRLGPQGLTAIQEAVTENCQSYVTAAPALFRGGFILDPEIRIAAFERSQPIKRNPYVERCRAFLKRRFYELYELIANQTSSEDLVRVLTQEIIPAAGFSGGIIYTIDPTTQMLMPQLKLGQLRLRKPAPLEIPPGKAPHDPVPAAWVGDEIICKTNIVQGDTVLAYFAGSYGYSQRYGVLYLEMPQLIVNGSEEHQLVHFKALCLALTDCLERPA